MLKKIGYATTTGCCAVFNVPAMEPVQSGDKIAFVGDSITNFGNRPDGFVHLVRDGLKRSGIEFTAIPAGVNGNKSNDILKRIGSVLAKKPQWMILMCGTNDVGWGARGVNLEDYKKNMTVILDKVQHEGVRVMLLTPSMHTESPNSQNNRKLKGYCEFVRAEAKKRKMPLADWNKTMHAELHARKKTKGLKLTIDNLHLNGYGNILLAKTILLRFGLDKNKIAPMIVDWRKIPSMVPILNAWSNPQYKISINDYEILYDAACKQKTTVDKLVKKMVADYIDSRKQKREAAH